VGGASAGAVPEREREFAAPPPTPDPSPPLRGERGAERKPNAPEATRRTSKNAVYCDATNRAAPCRNSSTLKSIRSSAPQTNGGDYESLRIRAISSSGVMKLRPIPSPKPNRQSVCIIQRLRLEGIGSLFMLNGDTIQQSAGFGSCGALSKHQISSNPLNKSNVPAMSETASPRTTMPEPTNT
jgi:hypothetical protein